MQMDSSLKDVMKNTLFLNLISVVPKQALEETCMPSFQQESQPMVAEEIHHLETLENLLMKTDMAKSTKMENSKHTNQP